MSDDDQFVCIQLKISVYGRRARVIHGAQLRSQAGSGKVFTRLNIARPTKFCIPGVSEAALEDPPDIPRISGVIRQSPLKSDNFLLSSIERIVLKNHNRHTRNV